MKIRVQAQHLELGDIVGSGETVIGVTVRSLRMPFNRVAVTLKHTTKNSNNIFGEGKTTQRTMQWGRYMELDVERMEKAT